MGAHVQNPDGPSKEIDFVTIADRQRLKWDALPVVRGSDDFS
jgi:hypothetical protein